MTVVVVVVVFATRIKHGKRAWMNAVSGHWNVTPPSWPQCLFPSRFFGLTLVISFVL